MTILLSDKISSLPYFSYIWVLFTYRWLLVPGTYVFVDGQCRHCFGLLTDGPRAARGAQLPAGVGQEGQEVGL